VIDARFAPVQAWPKEPTPPHRRKTSPFEVKYQRLLDDLERELKHLGARDIVIQAYFRHEDIRNDGWPRSSVRPSESGVILSFLKRDKQEIAFPCDTYTTYESNLRAISLTLTALRAIDRYGVTQHAEQYKGWAKLPPAADRMEVKDALSFIRLYTGIEPTSPERLDEAYRAAARKVHPDVTGSDQQFILLGRARQSIQDAYGWGNQKGKGTTG
jgi:hypothetical protein